MAKLFVCLVTLVAWVWAREPLTYFPTPSEVYSPPQANGSVTLLDLLKSHSELSNLSAVVSEVAGFSQAFDTVPTWQFTFFAPSNSAFNSTGLYYQTMVQTLKGKWQLGNLLTYHYIPNTALNTSEFTSTPSQIQTGNYLYMSVQQANGDTMLNGVARVTEANIPLSNGLVHIVDQILNPSARLYQPDLPGVHQAFIPGSCSNPKLPYC